MSFIIIEQNRDFEFDVIDYITFRSIKQSSTSDCFLSEPDPCTRL